MDDNIVSDKNREMRDTYEEILTNRSDVVFHG